ncbi:MAG: NUDIX hydrolase [Nitrospirae bacterium]|nr:NUDIX hydrolase [Nitrospirota bacterium]MBF0539979.1 NUDIX hydrolase [Nitrospirota bacterium]
MLKDNKIHTTEINVIFKNKYIELQDNDVIFPNGKTGKYLRVIEKDSKTPGSVIICINEFNEILLVTLYRYGIDQYSLEFPRGYKDKTEGFIDAGVRELREEVNIQDKNIVNVSLIGSFFVNTSNNASEVGVVLIHINSLDLNVKLEIQESIIESQWLPIKHIKEKIIIGEIKDSFTINAFMFLLINESSLLGE